jgi:hypothetical protein
MVETLDHKDMVVSKDSIRPWSVRVSPSSDDFQAEDIPVSNRFNLGDFIRNHSERAEDDDA